MSLVKPTTLAEYAELRLWLDSLREAKKLSEWGEAMRWYALNDLFFMVNEIISDGRNMHSEYGTPFYWHERYVQYCRDVEWQAEHGGGIDSSGRGSGKALALDTPVPTPDGWKNHGDLAVGDVVFDHAGQPCRVTARSEVWLDRDCYRMVFSDGTSIVSSAEHEWIVQLGHRSKNELLTTKDLSERRLLSTCSRGKFTGDEKTFSIPAHDGLVLPEVSLPIDPYVLGIWLGDGNSKSGRVTTLDDFVVSELLRLGYSPDAVYSKKKTKAKTYSFSKLHQELDGAGLLGNKHIPMEYMRSSFSQREALLQGLMDSDGYAPNSSSQSEYVSMSPRLANDVTELMRTLGLTPRQSFGDASLNGKYCGQKNRVLVSVRGESVKCFRLPRKASRISSSRMVNQPWPLLPREQPHVRHIISVERVGSVPTSCIEVNSGSRMYLAGPGMVPTHNSTIRTKSFSIQQILKHPDLAICIFSFTKDAAKKHFTTIMEELSRNKLLYALFPEVLYENPLEAAMNSETTWSKTDGLTVKRNIIRAQPTLSYRPYVGGTPTGGRFDILHVDDAEDDKVVSSKIFLEKLHSTYDATIPVLTPVALQVPVLFVTNTVYAENGLVKRLINRMKADGEDPRKCICYKAEDLTKDGDGPLGGEPLYPYTAKILKKFYDEPREKEMYGLQFLGDPIVTSQRTLSRDWLKSYPGDPQDWGRNKSIYICIDPSKGVEDPMAIWVWALGEDKKFSWVDGSLKKLDPAHRAFWDEIYLIARSWSDLGRLVEIRMEQYGQATYVEQLDAEMKKRGFYVPIVKVQNIKNQWSQKLSAWSGKYDRIYSRWAPPCQRGEVLIPTPVADGGPGMIRQDEKGKSIDLVEEFLYKEWLKFPKPISDNMLDAGSLIWENEGKDSKGNKIRRELQFPSVQRGKTKSRRRYSGTSFMSAG